MHIRKYRWPPFRNRSWALGAAAGAMDEYMDLDAILAEESSSEDDDAPTDSAAVDSLLRECVRARLGRTVRWHVCRVWARAGDMHAVCGRALVKMSCVPCVQL